MKKNIKALKYKLAVKKISKESALSTVASVEGWLKWANAYNLKKSLQLIEKGSTYAQIQIELHGELRVIFTNSTVLKEQLQRYKEHLPFCTTIIKNNKYFSFS